MGHVRNSGGILYQLPSSTGNLWLLNLNLVRAIRFDLGSISRYGSNSVLCLIER